MFNTKVPLSSLLSSPLLSSLLSSPPFPSSTSDVCYSIVKDLFKVWFGCGVCVCVCGCAADAG